MNSLLAVDYNTKERRQEKTIMKLVVDTETDKVLGASMCGPDAAEIMQDGEWNDFPEAIVALVRQDFQMKKAAIEVQFNGCHIILDVLYMLQVDLKTGSQKPIAWIDEAASNMIVHALFSK
ncbi:hypothetical protein RHGRI_033069 [Rhododendron griersonianum]|uniref:RCD1 WWE domain-containing protein n=1 Tax=Rhododendron griersonianum TaxID=479676 RepID=A0AAV6HYM7_9ERIC|nr:hypothetical protein RHGRI_033069 [Rhododendron griersonianum]